jgi:hypothetical protein
VRQQQQQTPTAEAEHRRIVFGATPAAVHQTGPMLKTGVAHHQSLTCIRAQVRLLLCNSKPSFKPFGATSCCCCCCCRRLRVLVRAACWWWLVAGRCAARWWEMHWGNWG